MCSLSRPRAAARPPDFCARLPIRTPSGSGRAWPRRARRPARARSSAFSCGAEEARDRQLASVRDQEQPLDAEFRVHVAVEPHPDRVERPFPHPAVVAHLAHRQLGGRDGDLLVGARAAVIRPERPIDQQHVEPARSRTPARRRRSRRPCPVMKLMPPSTIMKITNPVGPSERCGVSTAEKIVGSRCGSLSDAMAPQYREGMARKTPRKVAFERRPQATLKKARAGKAAKVKAPKQAAWPPTRRPPPARCRNGPRPRSRRRSAASRPPMPRREAELEHVDPYTLLVAVVLSAQATDAGVNKATPALFAAADTPAKMVALGEAQGARLHQDHRPVPHQGEERRRAVAEADRGARRQGAAVARGAGGAARRRPQDRQRRAQRRLRRADDRGRHPHLPRRQPHRAGAPARPRSRSRRSSTRWCRTNTSATPTTG